MHRVYKRQGNFGVCNELPCDTVGWVIARGAMGYGYFVVRIRKVLSLFFLFFLLSFCPQFLFLGLGSVKVRIKVRVRIRIVVWFRFQTVFTDRS